MNYDINHFIDDLGAAFYPPNFKDESGEGRWLGLLKRKLGHFDASTLKDAAEYLLTHRKTRSFPSLAEMINACEKYAPRDKARLEVQEQSWKKGDGCADYVAGEKVFEDILWQPSLPQVVIEAAKQDWISALRTFVIKHKRLPETPREEADCMAEAYAFMQAYEDCVRGGFPLAKRLEQTGDMMLKKREELRNRVLERAKGDGHGRTT